MDELMGMRIITNSEMPKNGIGFISGGKMYFFQMKGSVWYWNKIKLFIGIERDPIMLTKIISIIRRRS